MGNRCWMGTGFQSPGTDWEKQKWKQEEWLELWDTDNKKSNTSEVNTLINSFKKSTENRTLQESYPLPQWMEGFHTH